MSGQIRVRRSRICPAKSVTCPTRTPARRPARPVLAWLREVNFMPATARPAKAPATASETLPIEERIRRKAYELYLQRGNQSGSQLDDGLQAEKEICRAQEQAIDEASEESFPASDLLRIRGQRPTARRKCSFFTRLHRSLSHQISFGKRTNASSGNRINRQSLR